MARTADLAELREDRPRRNGNHKALFRLSPDDQSQPAEFFSLDQLERHGHALANWHRVAEKPKGDRLLARLAENAELVHQAYDLLSEATSEGKTVPPAAEWLFDNVYLVDSQIRMARQHLPRRYSIELPQLAGGPSDGLPRAYAIARELIRHADGMLDAENLQNFVAAYQSVTPLKLGELWAIPIMLRLALIENLRGIVTRLAWQQRDRDLGAAWAEKIAATTEGDPKQLIMALANLLEEEPPLTSSFVTEYIQQLQGRSGLAEWTNSWLEHRLAEHGQTIPRMISLNRQQQAADQVSIGNTITSLRSLAALNWKEFVEQQSRVEQVLRLDPAGVYERMNFATRDRYRHAVEQIAKHSPRSEEQIARVAFELSRDVQQRRLDRSPKASAPSPPAKNDEHLGYYLLSKGRDLLERSVGYRPPLWQRLTRLAVKFPLTSYLGSIAVAWSSLMVVAIALAWGLGLLAPVSITLSILLFALLGLIATQSAISLVNWLATLVVPTSTISRMDFSGGIPLEHRTLVIVPTMLGSPAGVASLLDQLETRYLGNRDPNIRFGLLTDFGDANQPTQAGDEPLLLLAREGIDGLNRKYGTKQERPFYLFHRPRVFNERERVWMGHERKRGKLADLNALLRGGSGSAFQEIVGDLRALATVRYVITLDTDTQLPRDSAHELVGCIAHPLNRPRFDATKDRVVSGYAILQPRVAITVPEAQASRYSRLFAGDAGIDPYTQQVSDVYQDIFGEGSFIGKGIYDLHAFEAALESRFPDNCILSHDLIESSYARSGLVTDIQLFEGFPSRYLADASRRHRWIRGDWQLLPWVTGKTPTARFSGPASNKTSSAGATPHAVSRNPISWLSRWKLFDNLRRSLIPPTNLLLLVLGWLLAPGMAIYWSCAFLVLLVVQPLISALPGMFRVPDEVPLRLYLKLQFRDLAHQLFQVLFQVSVLPYEAHWHVDAIARTLYRLFVSRRRMLEWTTASDAERRAKGNLRDHYELMFACPVAAFGLTACLVVFAPSALLAAAPFLLIWLLGPAIARHLSQPCADARSAISPSQQQMLRGVARRTWHFFETFVTAEDHWLAPDNFQSYPRPVVAHRTSPTNIGMGLISNLAAWDFGYVTATEMCQRLQRTLATLQELERSRGHFYNWYNTVTLQPIEPKYISSVDSGNLAGLLLTLKAGLEAFARQPMVNPPWAAGIADTFQVLLAELETDTRGSDSRASAAPQETLGRFRQLLDQAPTSEMPVSKTHAHLVQLCAAADDVVSRCRVPSVEGNAPARIARSVVWAEALQQQCQSFRDELAALAPWLAWNLPGEEVAATGDSTAASANEANFRRRLAMLDQGCSFGEVVAGCGELAQLAVEAASSCDADRTPAGQSFWQQAETQLQASGQRGMALLQSLQAMAHDCGELAQMDFRFLYDRDRNLLSIGLNASEHRLDASFYDLLASESRLASFVAISQGQLPLDHWFALGRMSTIQQGKPTLLSWSGSMFEYLMPPLIMPTYPDTLLDQACRGAVARQIAYGRSRGVPWGISESCYNVTDANLTYQYRAFGAPGLGLQRGLGDELVIAPYASVMAVMFEPEAATHNIERMQQLGYLSEYGFYDAVDYTPGRTGPKGEAVPCRTIMAHHSGMSFLALASVLLDQPMQRRFQSDPVLKAHQLLLQERTPRAIRPTNPHPAEMRETAASAAAASEATMRSFESCTTPHPEVQLLSNGNYHVMVSSAGGGYSQWNDLAITRWRPDVTRDHYGQFCYVRDLGSGELWSTTFQPTRKQPDKFHAVFSVDRAEFRRVDHELESVTTICVSPDDDVEVRRVVLQNISRLPRLIELTSYAEVVLAPAASDVAHRAFSNLFVQTELLPKHNAIVCTRRSRTAGERLPCMFHLMIAHGVLSDTPANEVSFETDRDRFIGRGRSLARPVCLDGSGPLSNSAGAVLDPVAAVRQSVEIAPEQSIRIDLVTGLAESRERAMALIEKYQDYRVADRVFELSWTHGQVMLKQLGATPAEGQLFSRLASALVFGSSLYRETSGSVGQNRRGQRHLWAHGISGDLPIVLLEVTSLNHLGIIRQLVRAHAYWRMKGVQADLVIWNIDEAGYRQEIFDAVMNAVSLGSETTLLDRPGGIFVRRGDQMSEEDRRLISSTACLALRDSRGSLSEQLDRRFRAEITLPLLSPPKNRKPEGAWEHRLAARELIFQNGLGGFTSDGKEYVIGLTAGKSTPAPWSNVLANEHFGSVVTESGLGVSWFENAHEFRLTPWRNDPVCDPTGECIYIRDEETGDYFSPTPLPARGDRPYVCRHGFGYTAWETEQDALHCSLTAFVAVDAPVKLMLLKIGNRSGRVRKLSVTGYVEWVLGETRGRTSAHIVTEVDPQTGAVLAKNAFSVDFSDRLAFFQASEANRSVTCDRTEFLGRNGSPAEPAALLRTRLSGKAGAGVDPCAAIQNWMELADGEERELVFILGAGSSAAEAVSLIQRFQGVGDARRTLEKVWAYWTHALSGIYLETPDASVNALGNGWLMYQTMACRFWGRSGFYQSGGAYGFRDQLQDAMALTYAAGHLTRDHLLRCAARQFCEGDVQHWWHPPTGRGVRTRISDDYLWLPFVAAHYVRVTGDTGVLDETAGFLTDRPLAEGEESFYGQPQQSEEQATLYEHCQRAIQHGLRFGRHGLPLMGSGDWNDGMNMVGPHGQGESVWLGFFLYAVLDQFAPLAEQRGDLDFAAKCRQQAARLKTQLQTEAWDGEWYLRAWFDDGTPLGSRQNIECQIDALPQSWAVLSGAGEPNRMRQAMDAVGQRLVNTEERIIRLFDPPFNTGPLEPGYIKGYLPGVRENGGQYTHAAIWTTMAYALMGDTAKAWQCFDLINPIRHGSNAEAIATYKVEPYVVAADVYGAHPHEGRGGWTWYTGSAGWMYRLIVEVLVGLRLEGGTRLTFRPCVPQGWNSFVVNYRFQNTFYRIHFQVGQPSHHVGRVLIDNQEQSDKTVHLVDDRREHRVDITLGI